MIDIEILDQGSCQEVLIRFSKPRTKQGSVPKQNDKLEFRRRRARITNMCVTCYVCNSVT